MVRFDFDWQVEKYVLVSLYGILFVLALVQLIRIQLAKRREGLFFAMRVRLQLFLFLGITARLITMALPVSFYDKLDMDDVWIQVIMDLIPELLFWLTYVVLVMLWASMYYGSMNTNKDYLLQLVFYGVITATLVSMLIVALVMQVAHVYNLIIEAIYLFVLSVFTVIAFSLYGFLLYLRAKRLNINVKSKDSMLQKLKWIAIIVCACDIGHCLYLVIVDILSQDYRIHPFIFIWFFYFLLTEMAPAAIILYIFRKVPEVNTYATIKDPPKKSGGLSF